MTFLLTDLLKVMVQHSIPLEVKEVILQGVYALMDVAKPFQYVFPRDFFTLFTVRFSQIADQFDISGKNVLEAIVSDYKRYYKVK